MPLLPAIADLPPRTASTVLEVQAARSGSGTSSASKGLNLIVDTNDDYLVEAPMEFLDVDANLNRGSQDDEPVGSGPFGF